VAIAGTILQRFLAQLSLDKPVKRNKSQCNERSRTTVLWHSFKLDVMKRGLNKLIVTATLAMVVLVAGVIVLSAFIRARTTSAQNACINNLRQIDGAKQQWALENNIISNAMPTWDDVRPYLGRGTNGVIPKCPQGGTYILNRLDQSPTCSIGGPTHSLPP
jgi:hypothetical protein